MRMRLLSVVLLFSCSLPALAEGLPPTGSHVGNPLTQSPTRAYAPASEQDKNAKLYQYISACMADRPGANKGTDDLVKKLMQQR